MNDNKNPVENQDMQNAGSGWQEEFTLQGFSGQDLSFRGRLFSEAAFYTEHDGGSLTRMRLFALEDKRLIYSITSGTGTDKERRVYVLTIDGELCHIDNGAQQITLPLDLLFAAVYGLCNLSDEQEEELRAAFNESLRAVGA